MDSEIKNSFKKYIVTAMPVDDACNMKCAYCVKGQFCENPSPGAIMSDRVLEEFVRQYYEFSGEKEPVQFHWTGGEPTLCGIDFFEKAVRFQKQYGKGRITENILNTNGLLLDRDWCEFLAYEKFKVAISLDGPRNCHDEFRLDGDGKGTFDRVMKAISLLKKCRVPFYTVTAVSTANIVRALEVYNFLKVVSTELHFIPVTALTMRDYSVNGWAYGEFMCKILVEWFRLDEGKITIHLFRDSFANLAGMPATGCEFVEICGQKPVIDSQGQVYSCEECRTPGHSLGNILTDTLDRMVAENQAFGQSKLTKLPGRCKTCPQVRLCFGGCPAYRYSSVENPAESGVNCLCMGYRKFFEIFSDTMKIFLHPEGNFFGN